MRLQFILFFTCLQFVVFSQNNNKKVLDHKDFDLWKTIRQAKISNNGQWSTYSLTVERGDPIFYIHHINKEQSFIFERGIDGQITADNKHVVFKIKNPVDSIRALKRKKVKDLPVDTLVIFDLGTEQKIIIPDVKDFYIPKKWSDWLVYQVKAPKPESQDSSKNEKPEDYAIIRQLSSGFELKIPSGKKPAFAKERPNILIASESKDSSFEAGVYHFDPNKKVLRPLLESKGVFKSLTFEKNGRQAAFLADLDTTDTKIRPFELFYWDGKQRDAISLDPNRKIWKDNNWLISEFESPRFSEDGKRLFFGMQQAPVLEDTTLLDEDKVNVEVWSWTDSRLYTHQESQLTNDKEFSHLCYWDITKDRMHKLTDDSMREIYFNPDRSSRFALGTHKRAFEKTVSWEGFPEYRKFIQIDLETNEQYAISPDLIKASPSVSPNGKYFYWYNAVDTVWQTFDNHSRKIFTVTNNQTTPWYDEINDRPMVPFHNGVLGWTTDDEYMLIYDRYDIWLVDPQNKSLPQRLTNGRQANNRYRYIKTDSEERSIDLSKPMLLLVFNEATKKSGYASFKFGEDVPKILIFEDFRYQRRPQKAKDADRFLFTKESFQLFPDLLVSDRLFKNPKRISNANPQQNEYNWGNIELYEWIAPNGKKLQGLLVKPENFDPKRKYPMIVNFYERSSDGLHRHRAPYPHRSTINYSFYASRGYVIFNPDVHYKVGYPGESAENCVISGTISVLEKGFVDKDKIGLQGHSWGGYQIAHLITRSNLYACAESGAPVVNMFSAYGGIRWGSGLSRMFQYEHTQSRIGGTIWDQHLRYVENSPLFFLNQVETPVLILHNDKDGAVPWYQGIEFFVGLRRLNKPAWLLNYNDEPHWPLKRQNRLDFNIRMQQFFDHYLQDAKQPRWMKEGVPTINKSTDSGID